MLQNIQKADDVKPSFGKAPIIGVLVHRATQGVQTRKIHAGKIMRADPLGPMLKKKFRKFPISRTQIEDSSLAERKSVPKVSQGSNHLLPMGMVDFSVVYRPILRGIGLGQLVLVNLVSNENQTAVSALVMMQRGGTAVAIRRIAETIGRGVAKLAWNRRTGQFAGSFRW
jgi:hypothetical protein